MNSSFSSVGSGEAIVAHPGAAAAAAVQNISTTTQENAGYAEGQTVSADSVPTLGPSPSVPKAVAAHSDSAHERGVSSPGATSSAHIAGTPTSSPSRQHIHPGHPHPHSHHHQRAQSAGSHHHHHAGSRSGSGSGAGAGSHSSSSRRHRGRGESQTTTITTAAAAAAARPSTTVSPAPTPAMHWSRAKVHGQIPPKELRAQTVNLVGESVYIFGGCDSKNCFNTLYIFDADTMHWSQPKTYGSIPPPCRAHSSTLVDNKRLYVFGGGDGPHYFNELYMLDTDTLTWTNPQTTGDKPCRRRAHTTCVYNNCIYVFGGGDGVQALNDTFKLDLTEMRWSEIRTTGQVPIARGYHTSNLIKSQFIVYGGSDGHECFPDVHVLDLDTQEWVKIDINRALPRLSHTATQVGSYLFVIGGHDGSRYSCDVVMLNLVTWSWETRKIYGIPPAGRGYHASLLYDSRLFVFGGYDGQTVFDDIYILDLSTCAYLPQITDFQILLRRVDQDEEDGNYGGRAAQQLLQQ
ncbi:hypothetical protein BGZ54_008886 [Gamsiella multidivaricata]|nr:hypothetical protein BGZ54_008886 [Gamsiella multidivaricata]